jgi:hypothetical protein
LYETYITFDGGKTDLSEDIYVNDREPGSSKWPPKTVYVGESQIHARIHCG